MDFCPFTSLPTPASSVTAPRRRAMGAILTAAAQAERVGDLLPSVLEGLLGLAEHAGALVGGLLGRGLLVLGLHGAGDAVGRALDLLLALLEGGFLAVGLQVGLGLVGGV